MSKKNIFGKEFDVETYTEIFGKKAEKNPRKIKNGVFIKYTWYYIGHLNEDDPMLNNKGIRNKQNYDASQAVQKDEALAHDYGRIGWDSEFFPPIIDQNQDVKDGRGRIRSALKKKEQWIPAALYSFDYGDRESRISITNGLILNKHPIAEEAKMKDFIAGGVTLILDDKQLELDKTKISDWLYNDCDIEDFFDNRSGTITKIIDGIYDRAKLGGDALLNIDSRERWIKYCNTCDELPSPINDDSLLLFAEGGMRPMQTWFRHILPRAAAGKMTYIVLYTTHEIPSKAREGMKDFGKQLKRAHDLSFNMVEKNTNIKFGEEVKGVKFKVLGCIPQVYNEKHQNLFKQGKLISVEDY